VNSSNPGLTQIEFLVDNSGSVVGDETNPKGCKGISKQIKKDVRFDFIGYIKGVLIHSVPSEVMPYLLLGMGTFGKGEKYTSLNWDSPQIPSAQENQTYYATGIRSAIDDMYKKYDVQRRFLIIVTDGAFTSDSVEDVRAELQSQVNIHKDLSIYVALLCPDESSLTVDVALWDKQINTLDNADVYHSLEDVTKKIFDELTLRKFLPSDSKSIIILPNEKQILIPGYATTTTFSYWSTDTGNILTLENVLTQESKSLLSGTESTFLNQPESECSEHNYTFTNSHSSKGLLFVKLRTFQNLYLYIDSLNENEGIEIINFSPVSFKSNILDEQSDNFGKWNDCFSASLVTQDGAQLDFDDQQLCGAKGNLCSLDNKSARIEFQWHPPQIENLSVAIKVNLIALGDNSLVWESPVIDVPIMFQASIIPPQNGNMPTPIDRIDRYFYFYNVVDQPHIYLISNLNRESFDAVGRNLPTGEACPGVTALVNGQLASEINRNNCPPTLSLDGDGTLINMCIMPELSLRQYQYNVTTYRYSVQDCGYKNILFTWQDLGQTKAITWKCDFSGNAGCATESAPFIQPISIP